MNLIEQLDQQIAEAKAKYDQATAAVNAADIARTQARAELRSLEDKLAEIKVAAMEAAGVLNWEELLARTHHATPMLEKFHAVIGELFPDNQITTYDYNAGTQQYNLCISPSDASFKNKIDEYAAKIAVILPHIKPTTLRATDPKTNTEVTIVGKWLDVDLPRNYDSHILTGDGNKWYFVLFGGTDLIEAEFSSLAEALSYLYDKSEIR